MTAASTLRLAARAVWYYRRRTTLLVAALSVVLALPLGLELAFRRGGELLLARARSTPLLLVPPGSAVDHVFAALYFEPSPVETTQRELEVLRESGLAEVVPVHVRYRAAGAPVVGTSLDYFERRQLRLAEGRWFGRLGEVVLGRRVAARLGLGPGDRLRTDPESPFDLTGQTPLELEVAGVLRSSAGPDDEAVFVDTRTGWLIAGRGHGHGTTDPTNPVPETHRRVDDTNWASFHFHGDRAGYPLTAVLVWPRDDKARTLLRARHEPHTGASVHLVAPEEVIGVVLARALRVRDLLLVASGVVGLASVALLVLVVGLSLALRRGELQTLARLGVSRARVNALLLGELALVILPALALALVWAALAGWGVAPLWRAWL